MSSVFRRPGLLLGLLLASLAVAAPALAAPQYVPGHLIIKFKTNANASERGQLMRQMHAQSLKHFTLTGADLVEVAPDGVENAVQRYRNHPRFEYVEPDYVLDAFLNPNDPRYPELYGMRNTGQTGGTAGADIKAYMAWDQFTGDPNILIGVIDTGVDYNHPDLAANIWTNPGEIPGNSIDDDGNGYVDDVHGYDFYNNDSDPFDDNGHGSHCSGTIAGVGNNGIGVVGVNWNAKIVGMKFLSSGGSGSTSGAIAAVQYAIAVGVKLTSNSWGGGGFSQALLDAINAAGAAGQLFVAAAGNSSQNTDATPSYPASYNSPYIIAVAATDHNDDLASFSNYGATTVDLGAPGVDILSTLPGNSYGVYSGTSMATPHVAGAAALTWGRYPGLLNLQVKDLLLNSADPKPSLTGKCLTGGRLNVFMAMAEPDSTPPGTISDLAAGTPASNSMRLTWTATGDDGNTGRAVRYDIRYSMAPITAGNFGSATAVVGPDPQAAGSAEAFEVLGLDFSTTYYFAIKAFDEFNNAGPISNVPMGTTLGIPDITAAPPTFAAELLSGASEIQTLTLTNDGEGTLDFTVPAPNLMLGTPVVYEPLLLGKDEADPRVGDPVLQGSGGPDAFGYRWVDSDDPGGPTFGWVDITGVGTPLTLTGDDAISGPLEMGISFPFYGSTFTQVRVCTNGFLSFTDAVTTYSNQPLPNSGAPANLVAPFWDDLNFGTTPRAYTHNDGTRFIVSWVGVPPYSGGGAATFQVILYPTGEIRYQYQSVTAPVNSSTVGIQNATKDVGLAVAFNTTYLHDNLAVRIAPVPQWLSVTPTSGRILAGQSATLQVHFNALGLLGGTYNSNVVVLSNDPDESPLSLPAQLHVIGAPDLAVNPASLDFGENYVGSHPTRTLVVSNPGTDNLVISNITSSDGTLSASPTAFTLVPLAAQSVIVTYSPPVSGTLDATLTVLSNDPDMPAKSVPVVGSAVPAPSFTVSPASFDVTLLTNTAASRTLRVGNTGGSSLSFTAAPVVIVPTGTVTVGTDADNVVIEKGEPDVQFGPAPLRSGGPDVFGYTYTDSDEPGGPAFGWLDIRPLGTQINMTGDDVNTGPYPVGFDFPFYGKTFNSFRICTNGFVSFTSNKTALTNTTLPNSGSTVPENLLAVFWDDMNFQTVKRAYYYNDGTKLVIQYQDAPRYNDYTHPNTFEIILYPNGTIVYQYLSITATLKNSCTIGIQNEARNDGLQVVYNALYIKDALAIRFKPPARFLTVSPTAGTVPSGGFVDLTVGFNAAGLFGGTYDGAVHLTSNDPLLPQLDVPSVLHVIGVPDIAVSPAALDFGSVYLGYSRILELQINNIGTDDLVVTNITSSNPAYGTDATNFTVPPLGNALVQVSFTPPGVGAHPGQLTIASNDPDMATVLVDLTGSGLVPPDISTTPASLASTLYIPDSEVQTLTVHNTGGSDLNFDVAMQLAASSIPVYEPIELGKEEVDPRPGVLGAGGPDLFGYRWIDSDEPGGPPFDWIDITSVGAPIPFTSDDQNLGPYPLPFSFPFYGSTFTEFRASTNGWISFTNTTTDYSNDPLPNTAAPENLLAMFWDDLTFSATGDAYYYYDGVKLIISYVAVPRLSSGGPYTFQVQLYPSGRIVYQYLDMPGTRLNEATIGIQNATKDDGLTVVYNQNYVHNGLAVELRAMPNWLVVSPTTGTIPAGGSFDLQVTLASEGLFGGLYEGAVELSSNDPDEALFVVPVALTAIGTPDLATVPASLDFGDVYVGLFKDLNLKLMNIGSDVLTITGASFDNSAYSFVSATFPIVLGERGAVTVTVRFTPTGECIPCPGILALASNDPTSPLDVALTGNGIIPPEIGVDPTSLQAALATTLGPTAIAKTKTLIVCNTGGSDLNFSVNMPSVMGAAAPYEFLDLGKDVEDPRPGILGSGGPDAFGYSWTDSDEPGGPTYGWVDISGVGTPIIGAYVDDGNYGPLNIGFTFPFYGNDFTQFRVCSNGWLSFTSTATQYTNQPLPNSGAPENLLAVFWDDMVVDPSDGNEIFYYNDGTRLIVQYEIRRIAQTTPPYYSMQVLLYPNGDIIYQYRTLGATVNSATIGIQNAAKDDGLMVVFDAAYVHENLAIRFASRPAWLTVEPTSGTVPAGECVTLQVTFNATGLADGDYEGLIRITSNDLDEPFVDVPCHLHVGVMTAWFDLDPNTLNKKSNGNWVLGKVELSTGHDAHNILVPSVLLQRTVPVDPAAPLTYADGNKNGLPEAHYKFDRASLLAILPAGNQVTVEVIGEEEDVSWFVGTDVVKVTKPAVATALNRKTGMATNLPPVSVAAGSALPLAWEDPADVRVTAYELWYSADAGRTWVLQAGDLSGHSFTWTVPEGPVESARLELVALDEQGPLGSWFSEPFTIATGLATEALPTRFALRLAGSNPARGAVLLSLAVPQQGDVDVKVFDVKGTVVHRLVHATMTPGWHSLAWDGRNTSGRSVAAGVYFVRMTAGAHAETQRVLLMR